MSKGKIVFKTQGRGRMLILEFDYPLDEIPGYEDLEESLKDLQEQIDGIIEGTAGVISFNERLGHVVSEDGDYTAAQVGADPVGSAASVLSQLNDHEADLADPHDTKADLQTFTASKLTSQEDNDDAVTVINGTDIFLNLEITQEYAAGDTVSFHVELPDVTGAAGNTEVRFELIYDKGGAGEAVIAFLQERIGNTQTTINIDITAVIDSPVASGTIGVYGTAVNGNTTVDGSGALDNYLLAQKVHNFDFKAYAA